MDATRLLIAALGGIEMPMDPRPEPGDITIGEIPGGYIVGRFLGGRTDDALWRHIGTTRKFQDAQRLACREAGPRRVWQSAGGAYRELIDCSTGTPGA